LVLNQGLSSLREKDGGKFVLRKTDRAKDDKLLLNNIQLLAPFFSTLIFPRKGITPHSQQINPREEFS